MKYNKILTGIAALAVGMMFSCQDDWDSHYEVKTYADGTLWQAISNDPNISNFKQVLEATGYNNMLNGSQVYTVFAPTNTNFTEAERDRVIALYNGEEIKGGIDYSAKNNSAIKEFVQNHIALYNYSASTAAPDTIIRMMNGKLLPFTGTQFDGKDFVTSNKAVGNGVLYTINNTADYVPNVFEIVKKKDMQLDSVANFLYMKSPWQFHVEEFKPKESVPGDIINGQQHYLDSVTVTKNELLKEWLGALLNSEDSFYYAVMPTNEVWKKEYDRNLTYFQYDKQVADRDSFMYVYPRVFILAGMQFSRNTNPQLTKSAHVDSIMSPLALPYSYRKAAYGSDTIKYFQFANPYDKGGIFYGTRDTVCSNGILKIADTWNVNPRETFLNNILQEAESALTLDSLSGTTQAAKPSWTPTNVKSDNMFYEQISNGTYSTLTTRTATDPGILLDLYDVLSNVDYDLYVTTVPARAADETSKDTLATQFVTTLYYHDATGNEVKGITIDDKFGGEVFKDDKAHNTAIGGPSSYKYTNKYVVRTDPMKVHRIKIGTINIPTCSYMLDKAQVKIRLDVAARDGSLSKVLRLDKIELIPHYGE